MTHYAEEGYSVFERVYNPWNDSCFRIAKKIEPYVTDLARLDAFLSAQAFRLESGGYGTNEHQIIDRVIKEFSS